jgi:hypothetical protein
MGKHFEHKSTVRGKLTDGGGSYIGMGTGPLGVWLLRVIKSLPFFILILCC